MSGTIYDGPYYVWDFGSSPWIFVTEFINPFGMGGASDGDLSLWIAKTYTELKVLSRTATTAIISANFTMQGNGAEKASEIVRVATGSGFDEERDVGNGMHSFAVPLNAGLNRVLIRSVEKVPLLIRGDHLSVSAAPQGDSVQISDIENPSGLERQAEDSFFWVGPRSAAITVSASSAGIAHLTATLSPGPSLVDKSKAKLWITTPSGAKIKQDLNWGLAKIDIPVLAGPNRITLAAMGPTVAAPGEPRTMMIGIRNLESSFFEKEPSRRK